jgi:cell wall-associated NlpC family hydrolase
MPAASADPVSNKKAQAQALASQINALGLKEAALGEQYDAAVLAAQSTAAKIKQQQATVAAANANAATARAAIEADAINAYVNGGSLASLGAQNSEIQQADGGLLANEYLNTLASTQSDNLDAFHEASLNARIQTDQLQALQKQQQAAAAATNAARGAAAGAQAQLQGTLNQVKGQLAQLVLQAQQAQQAAAARAAQARLASIQTSLASIASGGRAGGGGGGAGAGAGAGGLINFPSAPIPVGAGASEAVAAAESRVGDPYVWGAAGPTAFDCSGLVMWAWAKAGVSLPHFSGAQYADTTHISMSQLQPGDLVFFADPGEHVAMYVGGGMIVEAPHTGATVHVVPMYSEFVLASRP